MNEKENNTIDVIKNRLDIITIILLSKSGFNIKEIGKILEMSDKTISKLFLNKYTKISKSKEDSNE